MDAPPLIRRVKNHNRAFLIVWAVLVVAIELALVLRAVLL